VVSASSDGSWNPAPKKKVNRKKDRVAKVVARNRMQEGALKVRRKDLSNEGSEAESVDLQRDMDRKEEELKVRKAELENLKGTVEFSKAVKEDKWEMTAPEGEGLSMSSANEDMLNHLPGELLEEIIAMTVEDDLEEESQNALEDTEEEKRYNAVLSSFIARGDCQWSVDFSGAALVLWCPLVPFRSTM
jgi:hypothetical protein